MVKPVRVEYITPGVWEDDEPAQPGGGRVSYADQVSQGLVRGPAFVPAQLPSRQPANDTPAWLVERQPLDVGAVWTPVEGAQERTSAMDRAQALRVRLVPFLVTWGLIAVVVGTVTALLARQWPAGALLGVLLFAGLTAITYYRLNRTDYDYSREGTERHRLDTAADLARRRMNHEHELRRMALETYLKALERHEGGKR
jgi:hypothetical protein